MRTFLDYLLQERPDQAERWSLAPHGAVAAGVFPLFLVREDLAKPVGSAFLISPYGHLLTAQHNLDEGLKADPNGIRLLSQHRHPEAVDLRAFGSSSFSVLHCCEQNGVLSVSFCPLSGSTGLLNQDDERTPALDLSLAIVAQLPIGKKILPLPISVQVPRIGSTVYCVGYEEVDTPNGPIRLQELSNGQIDDWESRCRPHLTAIKSQVTNVFTQGFAQSYVRGACFSIDVEIPHGFSGGPVLDEEGRACGTASAGASMYFARPASLVSLLYPLLPVETSISLKLGALTINSTETLLTLIGKGIVDADGTERMVTFIREDEGLRVGPLIHRDDNSRVFDNFAAFQSSKPATKESRTVFRVGRPRNDGSDE